jgi:K+-sensing histidine kinase KdpD
LSEHPPVETHVDTSDPDAAITFTVLVIGAILVAAIVIFIQGLYEKASDAQFERKVVAEKPEELRQLRIAQQERLAHVKWVDKVHGIVTMPIDEAMAALVAEPNPAAPVVTVPAFNDPGGR